MSGIKIDYDKIVLHAISRTADVFPQPAIFCQVQVCSAVCYHSEPCLHAQSLPSIRFGVIDDGADGEKEEGDDDDDWEDEHDDDVEYKTDDIRFVPADILACE